MKLERILQINVAAMVALGALLLGMSQRSAYVTTLAVTAAVTSYWVTDVLHLFRLKIIFANVAGVIAVVICLADFFEHRQKEEQLLAIANLLVYLQMILLFQEKNNRLYGHLFVLSLLQVVVASALGLDMHFGVLLVLYMFTAISALCLFYFHRELKLYGSQATRETGKETDSAAMSTGATYDDLTSALTMGSLARCILNVGVVTLVIASGLFFAIPRFAASPWHGAQSGRKMLGFSPEVELNEVGRLILSQERVMRVNFYDRATQVPYDVAGEPYFRGTVLSRYSFDRKNRTGRWGQSNGPFPPDAVVLVPLPASRAPVRQDIVLAPRQDNILFSIYPPYPSVFTPNEVGYDVNLHRLIRKGKKDRSMFGQFRYSLLTSAFISGWQDPIVPLFGGAAEALSSDELEDLTIFDKNLHPTLSELADSILAEQSNVELDPIAQARALESHFRASDLYTYSLDFGLVRLRRNSNIDPIEDFVANHRTGHCEYFASALTLMLRSQGIPARLVVGYLGGDYNSVGKYYQVRQSHAHAWVEAYLDPDDVSQVLGPEMAAPQGAWLRLDPTPPSSGDLLAVTQPGIFSQVAQWFDYSEVLWNEYVVGLNSERQYRSIYQPLVERVQRAFKALFGREMWGRLAKNVLNGKWFHWRAGLYTAAILLILSGMVRFLREPLQQAMESFRGQRQPTAPRHRRVGFHMRLEAILALHGWQRVRGQTQLEFAAEVRGELDGVPARRTIAVFPRQLVDAFYRVRFGGQVLSAGELRLLELALDELETRLASREKERP